MITISLLKLLFWLVWIGLTFIWINTMRRNAKENVHIMVHIIMFGIYLLFTTLLILVYGGVYWW